jgi:hypothetical protein
MEIDEVESMWIPKLEDVLDEQKDLDVLCADRSLETKELFRGNAFYGNDRIIKAAAGVPETYPLKFVIPHGIVFSNTHFWEAELDSKLSSFMCYQANRASSYQKRIGNGKKVFRGAAPYTYIPGLVGTNGIPKRKGTIFFPAHSTHHITSEMDYELLAEELVKLDTVYQPVTVCIYWRDHNLGASKTFEHKGLRVVSAGHMFDQNFLFRLYWLCSLHKFSACNMIGSHIFYSRYAGCKHFIINPVDVKIKGEKDAITRDCNPDGPAHHKKLSKLFSSSTSAVNKNKSLLDSYLSQSLIKSRTGLRQILLSTELTHTKRRLLTLPGKAFRKIGKMLHH